MKARIPSPTPEQEKQLEQIFAAKLKEASLNGFMLGAQTAMKLAVERYSEDINKTTTFEELKPIALELLKYLENKAQGFKDVAENNTEITSNEND